MQDRIFVGLYLIVTKTMDREPINFVKLSQRRWKVDDQESFSMQKRVIKIRPDFGHFNPT